MRTLSKEVTRPQPLHPVWLANVFISVLLLSVESCSAFGTAPSGGRKKNSITQMHSSVLHATNEKPNSFDMPDSTADTPVKTTATTTDSSTEDTIAARRKTAAARAGLLAKRDGSSRRSAPKAVKHTSVGARRVGSATASRRGGSSTSKIMDALRKTAQGTSSSSSSSSSDHRTPPPPKDGKNHPPKADLSRVSQSVIHLAIEDILRNRDLSAIGTTFSKSPPKSQPRSVGTFSRTMGLLGDSSSETVAMNQVTRTYSQQELLLDETTVRKATPRDDVDIASLRLSVFSDFSLDLQNQFCARSCQAIAARRMRGASCLVATATCTAAAVGERANAIVGSVECSFHEFFGTRLGVRRVQNSILYVTEVAVSPSARRQGIGLKLLQAASLLAKQRDVETMYLHVDVANRSAVKLYEKAGYRKVMSRDPAFLEFTTSLNLHPGATKGRHHFLMYKDLVSNPTWLKISDKDSNNMLGSSRSPTLVGTFGFEIPA